MTTLQVQRVKKAAKALEAYERGEKIRYRKVLKTGGEWDTLPSLYPTNICVLNWDLSSWEYDVIPKTVEAKCWMVVSKISGEVYMYASQKDYTNNWKNEDTHRLVILTGEYTEDT